VTAYIATNGLEPVQERQ